MADELNIITTDANAVNVTTEDRVITITNDSDATTVTLSAAETTTVQIATIGPKGDKGDVGNIDTATLATTGSNTFNGNQTISGSLNITAGITGSLLGTASFATTASYALNAGAGAGFPFSGSAVITGSLLVTGGITGSFSGSVFGYVSNEATTSFIKTQQTGSFVTNDQTSSFVTNQQTSSFVSNNQTSSFVTNNATSSFVTNNQTSSFVTSNQTSSFVSNNQTSSFVTSNQTSSFIQNNQTGSFITNEQTSSFVSNTQTSSFITNSQTSSFVLNTQTGSFITNQQTGSFVITSQLNSYLTTGSSNITQTISGSLIIDQNLTVLGSQSIQYITSSQLNISTNLITVNTSTPAIRFGGIAVIDSGSLGTGLTGSLLWDSQENVWIYSNPSGSGYDGGMLLIGPRNTSGSGNEVGINSWYAAIGNGSHHMTSSVIWNSGSLIRLETNTQITGGLFVSNGITGSFSGSVVGYVSNEATTSFITNQQTSSFVTTSQTSSYVLNSQTSSFVRNNQTASFATTGSNTFIGNQTITGSIFINSGLYSASIKFAGLDSTSQSFDLVYPTNGALRFGVQGGDGPQFQGWGGTESNFPGQMYFDYGSNTRTVASRAAYFRNMDSGSISNVMILDSSGSVIVSNRLNVQQISGSNVYVGLNNNANINVVYPPQIVNMGGSVLFNRDNGDYITLSPGVDFSGDISTYGYIINCWFKLTNDTFSGAFTNGAPIIYNSNNPNNNLFILIEPSLTRIRVNASSGLIFELPETLITNKWYYLSTGYNIGANTNFLYLNGTASVDTYSDSGTSPLFDLIGADPSGNHFPGYITNLRVHSKPDSADFTSASAVPTSNLELKPNGNALLLLASSSLDWTIDSAAQQTITTNGSSIAFSNESPYDYYTSPINYIWNFNNDATLVLPQSGTILNNDLTPYTPISAQTASYVNPLNQNVIITGSLTVSGSSTFTNIGPAIFSGSVVSTTGFTGSFSGSVFGYVSNSATSSFITNTQTGSMTVSSSSFATTASYINPQFISASAAEAGFGSGGGGGLTYQQVQRLIALGS